MIEAQERLFKLPVGPLYCAVAVDVDRSARTLGDLGKDDVLASEAALPVVKLVQGQPPRYSFCPSDPSAWYSPLSEETCEPHLERDDTPCRSPARHKEGHEDTERTTNTEEAAPPP